jgi:hypothetical protein
VCVCVGGGGGGPGGGFFRPPDSGKLGKSVEERERIEFLAKQLLPEEVRVSCNSQMYGIPVDRFYTEKVCPVIDFDTGYVCTDCGCVGSIKEEPRCAECDQVSS